MSGILSKTNLFFLFLFILFIFFVNSQLMSNPPVWPDETYLADIATNIISSGNWGTDLWGSLIYGAEHHVYWYPPLYLLTLAATFKIFGISIFNQRILSVFIGGCFLIVYYLFATDLVKQLKLRLGSLLVLFSIFLIIIDPIFQRGTRIGRSEILVLLFITLGLHLFLKEFNKSGLKNNSLYFLVGLLFGLSTITHLISCLFFFTILIIIFNKEKFSIIKNRRNLFLVLGFILPTALWLISIFPDYYALLRQFSLQRHYHRIFPSHLQSVYEHGTVEEKIAYGFYIIFSIITLLYSLFKKNLKLFSLFLIIILGWIICYFGELEWYSIYLLPFIYLSTTIINYNLLVSKGIINKLSGVLISSALIYLIFINIKIFNRDYNLYKNRQHDHENTGQEITSLIPAGKSVYVSAIPDPYFNLKRKYIIYQFPPLPPKVDEYLKLLGKIDYVIINVHLEAPYVGGLLARYIDLNRASEYTVGKDTLHPTQVIQLTSRNQRAKP